MMNMMTIYVGTYLLLAAASVGGVEGFQRIHTMHSRRPAFVAAQEQRVVLHATTYYWDNDNNNAEERSSDLFDSSSSSSSYSVPEALSSATWTAPLARLAVGHCPPGTAGLKMEHIEQVAVRAVAGTHVDIEAIVCEDDGCVSLSVPVSFEQPCDLDKSLDEFEDCVLKNIEALDRAQRDAAGNRVFVTEEEMAATAALRCTATVELPQWWVPPVHIDLAKQCDSLLQILNEDDFAREVTELAKTQLAVLEGGADFFTVRQAAVVAVGPAGLILRASTLYDGEDQAEMVEVPIAFVKIVMDAESLRNSVLDCVEGVCSVEK
jgi:hypothetical protein